MKKCVALVYFLFFLGCVSYAEKAKGLDSLLNQLEILADKNDPENLRKKAIISVEIADWYQIKYADQHHTRFYLLQAITFIEEKMALEKNQDGQDILLLVDFYRKISLFEAFKGNKTESDTYISQCEDLLLSLKGKIPKNDFDKALFDFHHSLFALHFTLREYARGIEAMNEAFDVMENNPILESGRINLLSEISICYSNLGDHEKAIESAKEGLDLYHQNPIADQPEDRFIHFYIKALFLAEKHQHVLDFMYANPNYRNLETMEAYLIENRDLEFRTFFENVFLIGNSNRSLFESTGNRDYLNDAYDWTRDGFLLVEKMTLNNEAEKMGNTILRPREKVENLLLTASVLESNALLDETKITEIIRILDVYQSSRLHVERVSHALNANLWEREKEIKNELTYVNLKIEELGANKSKSRLDSLRRIYNELTLELGDLKDKTKREKVLREYEIDYVAFAAKLKGHLISDKKTLLIHFYAEKQQALFIAGVNPEKVFFKRVDVPVGLKDTIEQCYAFNSKIQYKRSSLDQQEKLNRLLYDYLIAPIQSELKTEKLLIYPLNEISFVSFDALLNEKNQYLVESYSTQYTSSLFSIIEEQQSPAKRESLLSFYPHNYGTDSLSFLFHGAAEVESIQRKMESVRLDGSAATKKAFLQQANENKVVHIASHSVLNFDRPYESYIIFDAADSAENRLFAYEIFSLTIETDLITLSSCNSAKGKIEEGIGVVSLSNAFYFAGVPATVSSLWSAQDKSSAEIMISFYDYLHQGRGKAESLRAAKLDFLAKADKIKRQPFFWANYVLYGRDTPLYDKGGGTSWKNYLIGIFLTFVLLFLAKRYFNSSIKS